MVRPLRWERGKDPNELADFSVDWTGDLSAAGDTISTSTWTFDAGNADSALVKATPSIDVTKMITTIWLSAGTTGVTYKIVNQVVTTGGRTLERSITIAVTPR